MSRHVNSISGRLSLRTPQRRSLEILHRVMEIAQPHKDGSTLYVDLSFGLVRDAAGAVAGVLAIARDCTERYLAEKARAAGDASANRT